MLFPSRGPAWTANRIAKEGNGGLAEGHGKMQNAGVQAEVEAGFLSKCGQSRHGQSIKKDVQPLILDYRPEIREAGGFTL